MDTLKVVGKAGIYMLVRKGRLASETGFAVTLMEIMQNRNKGEALALDGAAADYLDTQMLAARSRVPDSGQGQAGD